MQISWRGAPASSDSWRGRGHRLPAEDGRPPRHIRRKEKDGGPGFPRPSSFSGITPFQTHSCPDHTRGRPSRRGHPPRAVPGATPVVGASHGRVIFIAAGADILIHHDRSFLRDRGSAKVALQQALERLAAAASSRAVYPRRISRPFCVLWKCSNCKTFASVSILNNKQPTPKAGVFGKVLPFYPLLGDISWINWMMQVFSY